MAKVAKKVEVEDDIELEELDEVVEEEDAPKKKAKRADAPEFGIQELRAHLEAKTGKDYAPREIRNLLRKLARDGKIDRVITPDNRTRYSWTGPTDPEVKLITAAVKGGDIEAAKKAALDKLKQTKATKTAAAEKVVAAATTKKKKAAPVVEDDDDFEDDED